MSHHPAHDMVEGFALSLMSLEVIEQISLGAFGVLEDTVVWIDWTGITSLGQVLR